VDLEIDGVIAKVKLQIVPKESQEVPLWVGHPFTEQGYIQAIKKADELLIHEVYVGNTEGLFGTRHRKK
jgi:hypothetical protein